LYGTLDAYKAYLHPKPRGFTEWIQRATFEDNCDEKPPSIVHVMLPDPPETVIELFRLAQQFGGEYDGRQIPIMKA
jgi:hypothetical protein